MTRPADEVRAAYWPYPGQEMKELPEPPTLTLGAISDCLGFTVPSSLLADLGFPFVQVRVAKCYRPSDFPKICEALRAHISHCSDVWGNQPRAA